MKKFTKILESLSDELTFDDSIKDLQEELVKLIEDNSDNSDNTQLMIETIESYIEDSNTTIVGLVNDSDVFDFYIKNKNQIDIILSDLKHFEKSPNTLGIVNSIYDYVIESTKISIQEVFKKMINTTTDSNGNDEEKDSL